MLCFYILAALLPTIFLRLASYGTSVGNLVIIVTSGESCSICIIFKGIRSGLSATRYFIYSSYALVEIIARVQANDKTYIKCI